MTNGQTDRQTDGQTDGQNYNSQDRASVAALHSKNGSLAHLANLSQKCTTVFLPSPNADNFISKLAMKSSLNIPPNVAAIPCEIFGTFLTAIVVRFPCHPVNRFSRQTRFQKVTIQQKCL